MFRIRPFVGAVAVAAATFTLTLCALPGASNAAHADIPPGPVAEFTAPRCPGATTYVPEAADGPVTNLRRVFGARLDDYAAGRVVVLYSNDGDNDFGNPVPPTCATRYVAGVGPVSEWMYCTDLFSHTCGGTDADGRLVDVDGVPIPGMDPLVGPNPKLVSGGDNDREKLVAYLIRNGHPYSAPGGFLEHVTSADPYASSDQRAALQVLVWCITDPPGVAWPEAQIACDATLPPERQEELLALIPDTPTMVLDLVSPSAPLVVGETATLTLTTNVYERSIAVSAVGVAGTFQVRSGPAVLAGGSLIVSGSDPDVPEVVELGFTATAPGLVEFEVSTQPDSVTSIGWHQSPGIAADDIPCQVYAIFHEQQLATLADQASATFAEDPTRADIERLPDTGAGDGIAGLIAISAVLLGTALVAGRAAGGQRAG